MADGFVVVESSEDFIQPLVLRKGPEFPPNGILDWQSDKEPYAVFPSRAAARAAMRRTLHYAKAWEAEEHLWPQPKYCTIEALATVGIGQ